MEKKTTKERKKRVKTPNFSAAEKVRAILAIWTERRSPSEVCREMGVQWSIINNWQNRALEAMLQSMEPRVNLEKGAALSPRLQKLLQKKGALVMKDESVESRRLDAKLEKTSQKLNDQKKVSKTSSPPST